MYTRKISFFRSGHLSIKELMKYLFIIVRLIDFIVHTHQQAKKCPFASLFKIDQFFNFSHIPTR